MNESNIFWVITATLLIVLILGALTACEPLPALPRGNCKSVTMGPYKVYKCRDADAVCYISRQQVISCIPNRGIPY